MAGVDAEDVRQQRQGLNEALFREVNERLEETAASTDADGSIDFVCECADGECTERISLTVADYESIRSYSTRFLVRPLHVLPDVERVVDRTDDHAVVEKVDADAVAVVVQHDPRAR